MSKINNRKLFSIFIYPYFFGLLSVFTSIFATSLYAATSDVPSWAADAIWYNIFPERFRNGNRQNDIGGDLAPWVTNVIPELSDKKLPIVRWGSDWFSMTEYEQEVRSLLHQNRGALNESFNRTFGVSTNLYGKDFDTEIILSRRYGGDIQGIREKIAFLKDLGVNAIYLNPVFVSDSLHRYDTKDFRHIDPDLGPMKMNSDGAAETFPRDQEILSRRNLIDESQWGYTLADIEFFRMVNEFQKEGMRVVIDGVFNHSAANGIMMEDLAIKGQSSAYFEWIDALNKPENQLSNSNRQEFPCRLSEFFTDENKYPQAKNIWYRGWLGNNCFMPEHREESRWQGSLHPELQIFCNMSFIGWLEPKNIEVFDENNNYLETIKFNGVDGFRLDVYREVESDYWREFRKIVKKINPEAIIIAEDWYDGFDILEGDEADSLMNYTIRTIAENWFIGNIGEGTKRYYPSWLSGFVNWRNKKHRDQTKHALMTMLSSHDTDRVLSKTIWQNRKLLPPPDNVGQHLLWDDARLNMPHKFNSPYLNDKPNTEERDFFKSIVAFQMAYVGAPMIYYGDEVGMWGADDPTNRKPMLWGDIQYADETQCSTSYVDYGRSIGGEFFCLKQQQAYENTVDLEMLEFYKRMIRERKENKALRRGEIKTDISVRVNGINFKIGDQNFDGLFLWGFERRFEDSYAYFLSNMKLDQVAQEVMIKTSFPSGIPVRDVVTNTRYVVDRDGFVKISVPRDRAVLITRER